MAIEYKIERSIGVISEKSKGWTKEINLVSWNGRPAKFDIRDWSPDHDSMGKGVTLSNEEVRNLYDILKEFFEGTTISHSIIDESSITNVDIINAARES